MAVATGMNDFRTQGSTDVNTQQCPAGQVFYGGACVDRNSLQALQTAGGLSGTQAQGTTGGLPNQAQNTANTQLQDAFGAFRSSLEGTAQANIEASRAQTEANQAELARQLELQRQDYLTNRQNLQKETFLRGRNILSNLANRGLATSGLLQLGDVQRTIATGQQMNELSRAFENARQGLTAQQQAASRGQTAFEAQQRTGLAQQLASTRFQEIQMTGTEKERSVAYAESLASLLSDPNIPQATKDALAPLYEQLITTLPQTAEDGATPTTGGSLSSAFGTPTIRTVTSLIDGVKSQGGKLSSFEENALIDVISNSDMLKQGSPFMTDLAGVPEGTEVTATVRTKGGKAGLNDEYFIQLPSGQEYELKGTELAVLLMNNAITVSPEIALSIAQRAGGRLATGLGVVGNRPSSVIIPYLEWLKKNDINEKTVTNSIR